ncbi:hypothetical protein G210_5176, partial [Candida maltosa Xu316]
MDIRNVLNNDESIEESAEINLDELDDQAKFIYYLFKEKGESLTVDDIKEIQKDIKEGPPVEFMEKTMNEMSDLKDYNALVANILVNWPPYSPDLNPIENFWALMKRIVVKESKNIIVGIDANGKFIKGIKNTRRKYQRDALIACIKIAYRKVPTTYIKKCIDSFRKRLEQVIANGGRNTKY